MRLLAVLLEGHLYLAAVLVIFLAEIWFLAWGLLSRRPLIGLLAVFGMLPLMRTTIGAIRALCFRVQPPDGISAGPSSAPRLYDLVEEIRRAAAAPSIHAIVITKGFDAAAIAHRRWWPPGPRRTLVLGLPVLATMSAAELRAVIGHELAHFSSAHDRFAAWVYRTRRGWYELYRSLSRRMATPLYVVWLIDWYLPRLNAASAEVRRRHEIEADRISARVAGSQTAADALIVFEAAAVYADREYWPAVERSVEERAEPPRPFSDMLEWKARLSAPAGADTVASLIADDVYADDDHPPLRERFARLGAAARIPPGIERTAGAELLDGYLADVARDFDRQWLSVQGETWLRLREEFLERTERLARLSALDQPTPGDVFERGRLLEALGRFEEANDAYRQAFARGHWESALAVGRILLEAGDAEGVSIVEHAMDVEDRLVPEGCHVLAAYYRRTNQVLAARKCEWRATRHSTQARLAKHSAAAS